MDFGISVFTLWQHKESQTKSTMHMKSVSHMRNRKKKRIFFAYIQEKEVTAFIYLTKRQEEKTLPSEDGMKWILGSHCNLSECKYDL